MESVRSILVGLALFSVSLLLTLLGAEVLLRNGLLQEKEARRTLVTERPRSRMSEPDFRQPGYEPGPKAGTFRILVLGDSFSWGDGVYYQDTFPYRLESRLNDLSRKFRFEVINWSRPGWNTVRQLRSLEPRMAELDPDVLVLAFVLNDPEPLERPALESMLLKAEGRQPSTGLSSWLFHNSRLYALVWSRLENSRTHRELSNFYHRLYSGDHWETCRRSLRRLRRLARQQGIPMILMIFPVFDSPMDHRYPYADLHDRIRQEGEALNLPVLDLLPAVFEGVDTRRLAVVPFTNAHPTELAHRLTADGLLDYLVRGDYLPPIRYRRQPRRR